MKWQIRTKMADHENAPPVYLVVMTGSTSDFHEHVDHLLYWHWDCQRFFSKTEVCSWKRKNACKLHFFAVRLYLYVPRENNSMIQCNDLFLLVVVSYLKFQKIQLFSVLFCKTKRHNCLVFKCICVA